MDLLQPLVAGFFLDQILGDPPHWPHPVRWIGRLSEKLEPVLRKLFAERIGGVVLVVAVVSVVGGCVWGLHALAAFQPAGQSILATLLIYFGLSSRSLADHAEAVGHELRAATVRERAEARGNVLALKAVAKKLSLMVGRDTDNLSQEQICRACVESVAENTTDGVVAPLFYAALFGPIGLWVYKAINTLDSTVGYRNPQYHRFGWAAARLDDFANFIPARLTLLLMPLAALFTGASALNGWRIGFRDGRKHSSPNAGLAEAAMAGVLGVQLGGFSTYAGIVSEKPTIGDPVNSITPGKIRSAVAVMLATSWLMLVLSGAVRYGLQLIGDGVR